MKDLLTKYFGILGLVIYVVAQVIIRIPVAIVLSLTIILLLVLWNPITRRDDEFKWVNHLYDWYNAQ